MQIFIDLDGPILDVTRRYYLIYSDLLKKADFLPFDQDSYWSLKRLSINESAIVQRNMPLAGVTEYLDQRGCLVEDPAYLVYDKLHTGALDTINAWASDYELNLVTLRRNRAALMSQLDLLGLRGKFDRVFCAQGVEPGWQTKCEWIRASRTKPGGAVIIGDTEVDVLAGRAAGIYTVALSCGIRSRQLLEQLSPDALLSRLSAVDLGSIFDASSARAAAEAVR
jgi:phosphoglycolate phosphatase-like HAD superfamily hydrolase